MPRPRRPFTFWAMAILFVFFSLFGVLVIVTGRDTGGRLSGVTILLVFGFGGFAYVSGPAMTRHGPATVRRDRVQTSAGSEPAFVFPSPRAKRRAAVIGLGGIAVGTVGMLAITGGGPFLIAGTVLLCLVFVWALIALRRPQLLALTPTRVVAVLPSGAVEVRWDAGVDAEIYPMPTGHANVDMVGIIAADPAAASPVSRYLVSMGADSFAGEGEDVVAAIRLYAADPEARRRIGGEEEHGRLLRVLGETAPQNDESPAVAGLPGTAAKR